MSGSTGNAKEIFLAALDFESPEALARHLDVACGGNAELRARVEELLNARQAAGAFLGGDWSPSPQDSTPVDETPGEIIGPYKLIEQIGEGGFGVVFRAEQQRPVRRDVALKIIKLGMDTKQVVARFEAERQALAMMDHPGIAKVFDAGSTDSGRAYFVMELVRGVTITDYCDRRQLGIDQRLDLFVQTCQAVQHAHQKGLIHRDLKPSNVLVGEVDSHPIAKVIDFGIAKATQARLTEESLFTDLRQLVGTPEYMSPEQAGGSPDVDTRSDVYSLGVLLYELLTGAPPFDPKELRSKAFAEVQRIIREVEPPTPSTRLSALTDSLPSIAARRAIEPRRLDALVRGDLDWITMKALEKDRARRYESAAALAADVMHHLADEPVEAAAPSRLYRWGKFVQRNKLAVGATAAVITALLAGVVGTTIGMIGQSRQRTVAEEQRADALAAKDQLEAVNKFLTEDVLGAADPVRLPDKAIRDQFMKVMIDPAAASVAERFKDKPLVEAAVRHALSAAYENVGRSDLALPHAQRELAIHRQNLGNTHPDTLKSAEWVGNLQGSLGQLDQAERQLRETLTVRRRLFGNDAEDTISSMMSLAGVLQTQGKQAEAEKLSREALEHARTALPKDSETTIAALNNLAYVLQAEGKFAEAEPLMSDALARSRRMLGENHRGTLRTINNMGTVLRQRGKFAEAEPYWKEALDKSRTILGDDHPETIDAIGNMAELFLEQGKLDAAEPLCRETLERNQRMRGQDHPDTIIAENNWGNFLRRSGRFDEAKPISRDAFDRSRRVNGDDHPTTISTITDLGRLLLEKGELDEAELLLREAYERASRVLPETNLQVATSIQNLADLLYAQGEYTKAEPLCLDALKRRRIQLGDDHLDTIQSIINTAALYHMQGRPADAEPLCREALERSRRVLGNDADSTLTAISNLGYLLLSQGKLAEAKPLVREAMDRSRQVLGENHRGTLQRVGNMGVLLQAEGKISEAEPYYREALETSRRVLGDDHPGTMEAINSLARLCSDQGKFDKAEQLYREALDRRERVLGPMHPETLISLSNLGLVLRQKGDLEEAEKYSRKALDLSRQSKGDKHPDTLFVLNHMGTLMTAEKKFDKAEGYLREALTTLKRDPDDHLAALHSMVIFNMANLMQSQEKFDAAESLYREVLDRREKALGPNHPDTLLTADNFGGMYMEWDKPAKAEPLFRNTISGLETAFGNEHVNVGYERRNLGAALVKLKRFLEAEAELLTAERILSAAQDVPAARRERLDRSLVELYEEWDKSEPGEGYGAKAQPWRGKLPAAAPAADATSASTAPASTAPASTAPAPDPSGAK